MAAPSVLVADDDPHIRDVIVFTLERAGMAVAMVCGSAAAIRMGLGSPPAGHVIA